LGQGAPEVDDDIEGSFERPKEIDVSMTGREYGPTAGIKPLRAAVANLYNVHHRQGKASQYSWENVCIVPGGRAGLIRIAAVLNNAYLGFFIPDYTAYNEMLSLFKNVSLVRREINAAPLIGESWHLHVANQSSSPQSHPRCLRRMDTISTLTRLPRKSHVVPLSS
jgi:aspartate/methionine/tyrosine aminotransferase